MQNDVKRKVWILLKNVSNIFIWTCFTCFRLFWIVWYSYRKMIKKSYFFSKVRKTAARTGNSELCGTNRSFLRLSLHKFYYRTSKSVRPGPLWCTTSWSGRRSSTSPSSSSWRAPTPPNSWTSSPARAASAWTAMPTLWSGTPWRATRRYPTPTAVTSRSPRTAQCTEWRSTCWLAAGSWYLMRRCGLWRAAARSPRWQRPRPGRRAAGRSGSPCSAWTAPATWWWWPRARRAGGELPGTNERDQRPPRYLTRSWESTSDPGQLTGSRTSRTALLQSKRSFRMSTELQFWVQQALHAYRIFPWTDKQAKSIQNPPFCESLIFYIKIVVSCTLYSIYLRNLQ